MTSDDIKNEVLKMNQSDFLRHYLFVNEQFLKMKTENPVKTSVLLNYVRNPEKVKERVYQHRLKKKNSHKIIIDPEE
jgi:hypothetical protein